MSKELKDKLKEAQKEVKRIENEIRKERLENIINVIKKRVDYYREKCNDENYDYEDAEQLWFDTCDYIETILTTISKKIYDYNIRPGNYVSINIEEKKTYLQDKFIVEVIGDYPYLYDIDSFLDMISTEMFITDEILDRLEKII